MERLRKLHRGASKKAQSCAITLGVIGTLMMGMSLAMTELGDLLEYGMAVGAGVGIVGMILVALAHPLYNRVLRKERERIAPQILQLTDELLK
jgi:hypothetical protein